MPSIAMHHTAECTCMSKTHLSRFIDEMLNVIVAGTTIMLWSQ